MTNTESNNIERNKFVRTHHGFNVQVCRFIRKCKQQTLADHIGVCKKTMSKIESKPFIDDETLVKIGEFLNFSLDFMKELNDDSELSVVNVYDNGKNYQPGTTDGSVTNIDNDIDNGIPVENYDKVYDRLIQEKENAFELVKRIMQLEFELKSKQKVK